MSTEGDPQGLWPEAHDRLILDECRSTMEEAARRAADIVRPTWVLARRQTGGHGRRGRPWTTGEDDFAATLIMKPDCTPAEAARRSFLAANALFETLAIYIDRDALALKWPNDVLLNEGKVAGILLESAGAPYVDWLAIGIGVNLVEAPPDDPEMAARPVALFDQGGERVAPEDFLTVLASNYATQEGLLAEFGFAHIRDEWLEHAARLGEVITARTVKTEITGTFETVDEEGNLILLGADGRHVVPAADIYF